MLRYPVAKIKGIEVHLERLFFGVKKKNIVKRDYFVEKNLDVEKLPVNTSLSQLLSEIDFVKVYFLASNWYQT